MCLKRENESFEECARRLIEGKTKNDFRGYKVTFERFKIPRRKKNLIHGIPCLVYPAPCILAIAEQTDFFIVRVLYVDYERASHPLSDFRRQFEHKIDNVPLDKLIDSDRWIRGSYKKINVIDGSLLTAP